MHPSAQRIDGLRGRFGVSNGQFFAEYKYKNLNWYLATSTDWSAEWDEWFCFGDVREEDLPRLQALLVGDEQLVLGWKELSPNQKFDSFFRDGGGIWLIITKDKVLDAVELQGQERE